MAISKILKESYFPLEKVAVDATNASPTQSFFNTARDWAGRARNYFSGTEAPTPTTGVNASFNVPTYTPPKTAPASGSQPITPQYLRQNLAWTGVDFSAPATQPAAAKSSPITMKANMGYSWLANQLSKQDPRFNWSAENVRQATGGRMLRAGETFDPAKFITGDKSVSQIAGAEKATYVDPAARKREEATVKRILAANAAKRQDAKDVASGATRPATPQETQDFNASRAAFMDAQAEALRNRKSATSVATPAPTTADTKQAPQPTGAKAPQPVDKPTGG